MRHGGVQRAKATAACGTFDGGLEGSLSSKMIGAPRNQFHLRLAWNDGLPEVIHDYPPRRLEA